jgi:hypothetical protein
MLVTFSDSDGDRDDAWTILGTDGLEIKAGPIYGPADPSLINKPGTGR